MVGRSGLSVSRLALGTMTWGGTTTPEEARELLTAFTEAGGDLVDTAHGYGDGRAEEMLGSLIGDVVDRDDLALCTKAGISRESGQRVVNTSRRALARQLDRSLARLGTDHVDLWLDHTWSDAVPLEETLGTLEWAVQSGRARYVGVSNYGGWQTARAATLMDARVPLVANESEYSLVNRVLEDELLPASRTLGVGLLPWSPQGRGVLTGKYRHGIPADSRASSGEVGDFAARFLDEDTQQVVEALVTAARGLGVTATEVALAWVRDRPGVVAPVVGTRTLAQLRTVLRAEDLVLPEEIVRALDDVSD
jgi:aryl-alcohol dehydrogenase-like predicted oxidoreductase